MITVKVLKTKAQLDDASALLYQVYMEHLRWEFSQDNPSALRVVVKNNRKLLVDRFTDIATWFGAYDGEELVGCSRLCGADENGKFEVEGYVGAQVIGSYLDENSLECSKIAANPDYKGKKILERLLLGMLEYASKKKKNFFGLTGYADLKSLFIRIGLPLAKERVLTCDSQRDRSVINLYFVDFVSDKNNNCRAILTKLEEIINQNKSAGVSILKNLQMVAPILPVPVYWQDLDGVILGINESCLRMIGATNIKDILGKTPCDFYPKKLAENILAHNLQVMLSGEVLSQHEKFKHLTTGEIKYVLSIKSPLYDDNGHIIGVLGVSVATSDGEEIRRLKKQNQQCRAEMANQDNIIKYLNDIQQIMQSAKINILNNQLKSYSQNPDEIDLLEEDFEEVIRLSKREQEIIYYLSLSKSPKEIAMIISIIENKKLSPSTISSIIDKQLYPKFKVSSISELIEKASILKLIPFMLNNTKP